MAGKLGLGARLSQLSRQRVPAWVMLACLLALTILPLLLPPPYPALLLGMSVALGLAVALFYYLPALIQSLRADFPRALRQPRSQRVVAGAGSLLVLLAAYLLRPATPWHATIALNWLLVAAGVLGVSIALRRQALLPVLTVDAARAGDQSGVALRWRSLLAGVIALVLLVQLHAPVTAMSVHILYQLALLLGGIALVARGLIGRRVSAAVDEPAAPPSLPIPRLEIALLAGIVLLALLLRVVNLEYGIYRFVDEMHSLAAVADLREDPHRLILSPHGEVTAFTWLFPMLQSAAYSLYGPTLTALRVISALFGALTVLALWWLARELFDRETALLAALILATYPQHLHFSRIGLNNVVDPLFGTLALIFLVRGIRSARRVDFVLGGVMLGLTQYFYEGGRLLYPLLIVSLLVFWAALRRREGGALPWGGIRLFALAAGIVTAPVYLALATMGLPAAARLGAMTVRSEQLAHLFAGPDAQTIWWDVSRFLRGPFWHYVQLPDGSWFYGGDTGLALPVLLPFFLLGVIFALWRLRAPGMALIVLWLLGTAVGNLLMAEPTWTPRYVVGFPAIALAAAIGLRHSVHIFLGTARARRVLIAALVVPVLVVSVFQAHHYFFVHREQFREEFGASNNFDDLLLRVVRLPPETDVFAVVTDAFWATDIENALRYYGRIDDIRPYFWYPDNIHLRLVLDRSSGRNAAVFFSPALLEDDLPRNPGGDLQFSPYHETPAESQYGMGFIPAAGQGSFSHAELPPIRTGVEWHALLLFALAVGAVRAGIGRRERIRVVITRLDALPDALLSPLARRLQVGTGGLRAWTARPVRWLLARLLVIPAPVMAGLSALLTLAAVYHFRPGSLQTAPLGAIFSVMALAALGVAVYGARAQAGEPPAVSITPTSPASAGRFRPWRFYAGMLLLILFTLGSLFGSWMDAALQMGLLAGGVALLVLAHAPGRAESRPRWRLRSIGFGWLLPGGIVLLALLLRVYDLEYTIHRHIDEVLSADAVIQLWQDPLLPLLSPYSEVAAFTRIYSFLQAVAVELFDPTLTALRVVSALFGALTVAALYWLARELFDRRTALLAALLLATFPPHLHFSRIGLNNAADPFFGTLALVFLARGILRRTDTDDRLPDFALAGAMLGLTQYFYEGGRLLYPLLLPGFLWLAGRGRVTARGWLAFAGVGLLVAAPVYIALLGQGMPLLPRLQAEVEGWAFWRELLGQGPLLMPLAYVENLHQPLWFYVQQPDASWFYAGETALLLVWTLPFFLLGVFLALWGLFYPERRAGMILIVLWLLAVAAGNSALTAKTDSPRYVVVFPALALTAAVGLRYFPPLLVRASAARRLALVAVGLSLAVIQTGYYFRVHIPQFIASAPQPHIMDDARFRAAELPDNTHVYIITPIITFEFDSFTTLRYRQRIADGVFITTLHPAEFDDWHLRAMIPQRNYAFFIAPDDDATRALLAAHPEFDLDEPQRSPYDMTFDGLYELYFVPRGWEEADR